MAKKMPLTLVCVYGIRYRIYYGLKRLDVLHITGAYGGDSNLDHRLARRVRRRGVPPWLSVAAHYEAALHIVVGRTWP
jgi:hypothetical protein